MIQASGPYNVFGDNAYASLIGSLREATQGLVDVSIYFFHLQLITRQWQYSILELHI